MKTPLYREADSDSDTCGGLELFQMISELVTGRCETLVKVGLDSLRSRHILKPEADDDM